MSDDGDDADTRDTEPGGAPHRRALTTDRGLDRLVNFSDAVVAIAITLIILPLVDTAQEYGGEPVSEFLGANAAGLAAAALSFVVIATFWRDHHRLFERTTGYSQSLITMNFVWLAGIVFLPLPTVLIVDAAGNDRGAAMLYIATMLVSMVAVRVQHRIIVRDGLLREDAPEKSWILLWAPTALMLLAFLLSALVPGLGTRSLFLLLLSLPLSWVAVWRRSHRAAPRQAR